MIYYVDPENGSNSSRGLDPLSPLKDLSVFYYKGENTHPILHYGDKIALKRGTTLYGSHFLYSGYGYMDDSVRGYITITSYGSGDKPKLSLAKIVTNSAAYSSEGNGVWSIDLSSSTYPTGYTVKDTYAYNVGYLYDDRTDTVYGDRKFALTDLVHAGDFYVSNSTVYMKFPTNPVNFITKIIGNHSNDCLFMPINNMIFEDLCFTECSTHGIKSNINEGFSNIIVRNCDFINLGGAVWSGTTRLGNGVEIYGTAKNWTVCNNRFINIYDTATTAQGNASTYTNIHFRNNYIERCSNSFEVWCDAGADSDTGFTNVTFSDNIILNNGKGIGNVARTGTAAILLLGDHQLHDISIKNNTFIGTRYYVFNTLTERYKITNNKFIGTETDKLFGDNINYTCKNITELERNYSNYVGNSGAFTEFNTDLDRMASLALSNNAVSISTVKHDTNLYDNYSHIFGPDQWIMAQGGTVNITAQAIIGNLYFYDFTITPSNNINAWTTLMTNRDARLMPTQTINITDTEGRAFQILAGVPGSNSAVYMQSFEGITAGTSYHFKGFYNIY